MSTQNLALLVIHPSAKPKEVRTLTHFLSLFCLFIQVSSATEAPSRERLRLGGLYVNGQEPTLLNFIRNARKSLDLEIYEMTDPDVRQALRSAMKRGVKIRVIKEMTPVGVSCNPFKPIVPTDSADCVDQKLLPAEITAHGGVYVPFNKEALCGVPGKNCYAHGKLILRDGEYALISTGNFNSTSLCNLARAPKNCNRDYSYITAKSDLIKFFKTLYELDVRGQSYDLPELLRTFPGASELTVSPHSRQPMIQFIESAGQTLDLQNQYFNDPIMNQALIEAAQRGIQVRLMVASFCTYSRPSFMEAQRIRQTYAAFEAAGIQTRIFTSRIPIGGRPGYLHAKAMVADGKRAWIGSVNGSITSLDRNREFGIFFEQVAWVGHLFKTYNTDFLHPMTESWQESLECIKDRSFKDRSFKDRPSKIE